MLIPIFDGTGDNADTDDDDVLDVDDDFTLDATECRY